MGTRKRWRKKAAQGARRKRIRYEEVVEEESGIGYEEEAVKEESDVGCEEVVEEESGRGRKRISGSHFE